MKILLLSAYDATSHRYWREGLVQNLGDHQWTVATLPARHFSWRIRGNSLTFAHMDRIRRGQFDLIIATSMTDLATLKGLVPTLGHVPAIVYFHENQFDYPVRRDNPHQVDRQLTTIYTALAATRLVFNSEYNRRTFFTGAKALLAKMPDGVPGDAITKLSQRSSVIPVALSEFCFRANTAGRPRTIVWNHRWEYDKGVLLLQQVLIELVKSAEPFVFHLLGEPFHTREPVMQENLDLLARHGRLGKTGFIEERDQYLSLLASCHVVLSTALHEFQGISVQEAMATGCIPIVPDRLVYPEYVMAQHRYASPADAAHKILHTSGPVDTSGLPRWKQWRANWYSEIEQAMAY